MYWRKIIVINVRQCNKLKHISFTAFDNIINIVKNSKNIHRLETRIYYFDYRWDNVYAFPQESESVVEFANFLKSDAVTSNTVCKLKWQTFLSFMAGSQCSIASHSYILFSLVVVYIVHRIVNKSLKFANTYTNIHIIYV